MGILVSEISFGPQDPIKKGSLQWLDGYKYTVGDGPINFIIYNPHDPKLIVPDLLRALQKFAEELKLENNGQELITGQLLNVGWVNVQEKKICLPGLECPDIIIIGTTQIAYRVRRGVVEPLTEFIGSDDSTSDLPDTFSRFYFYDFFIDEHWMALPLVSDIRVLFYNRTIFDQAGLKYPPPDATWGQSSGDEWTWTKFVEYSKVIKDAGLGYGSVWNGGWDEELKWLMMIAQSYRTRMLTSDMKCALNNPQFKKALREIVEKIWLIDDSAHPLFTDNIAELNSWIAESKHIPLPESFLGAMSSKPDLRDNAAMQIISPSAAYDFINDSDIHTAFVPGKSTFLGGSGMIMTKAGNKTLAWRFMKMIIDPDQNYLQNISASFGRIPPYDNMLQHPPFQEPQYQVQRQQMQSARPPQYPSKTFSEYGNLEIKKPFRLLMAELVYKNMSINTVIENACKTINKIFAPQCTEKYWNRKIGKCQPSSTFEITFSFNKPDKSNISTSTECTGTYPDPVHLSCSYAPFNSIISMIVIPLSVVGIIVSIIFTCTIISQRKKEAIRAGSYFFSSIMAYSWTFLYLSVIFNMGKHTTITCISRVWLLQFGYICIIAGLFVKLYRIYIIFHLKTMNAVSKISDKDMMKPFSFIIIIDIILLILWTVMTPPGVNGHTKILKLTYTHSLDITNGEIEQVICSGGHSVMGMLLIIFSSLLLLVSCYISWKLRQVPKHYQETKAIVNIVIAVGLGCVVITPVLFLENSTQITNIFLKTLGTFFGSTVSLIMFIVSKSTGALDKKWSMSSPSSKRTSRKFSSQGRSFRFDTMKFHARKSNEESAASSTSTPLSQNEENTHVAILRCFEYAKSNTLTAMENSKEGGQVDTNRMEIVDQTLAQFKISVNKFCEHNYSDKNLKCWQ